MAHGPLRKNGYQRLMDRIRAVEVTREQDWKEGRSWIAKIARDIEQIKKTVKQTRVGSIVGWVASTTGLLVIIVTNWHTVLGWISGPAPKWEGMVTLGLSGDNPTQGNLVYKLTLDLSNKGDNLGGPGAIVLLGPPVKSSKPPVVAYETTQSADDLGLYRSIEAGGGVPLGALPKRLLACVWSYAHPRSTFPVYLVLASQDAMLTHLSGIFADRMVGYVRWAVLPTPPTSGDLTKSGLCGAAHTAANAQLIREAGLVRTLPVVQRKFPSLARPLDVSYQPAGFGGLATWNVRVAFATDTPTQFFDSQSEYSSDGKTWFAASGRPQRIGNYQLLQLHGMADAKSLTIRYTTPKSQLDAQPLDFAGVARQSLKARLLSSGDWIHCHAYGTGECNYVALAVGYPALKAIYYGGDDSVTSIIPLKVDNQALNGDYRSQACVKGLKAMDLAPTWNHVVLQLEFTDNTRSDKRAFLLPASTFSMNPGTILPADNCRSRYLKVSKKQ